VKILLKMRNRRVWSETLQKELREVCFPVAARWDTAPYPDVDFSWTDGLSKKTVDEIVTPLTRPSRPFRRGAMGKKIDR
jgi:hypothetical protein